MSSVFFDCFDGDVVIVSQQRMSETEIAFDFRYKANEHKYTVFLKKNNGSLYRGKATNHLTRSEDLVTARVFKDEDGAIFLFGSTWLSSADKGANYRWVALLENNDE